MAPHDGHATDRSTASRSRSRSLPRDSTRRRSHRLSWSRPLSWSGRRFPLSPEPPPTPDEKEPVGEKDQTARPAASQVTDESPSRPDLEKEAGRDGAASESSASHDHVLEPADLEKAAAAASGPIDTDPPAKPGPLDPRSYPDGGAKAWLTVLGGFCCLFVSFGWINAIGIFQDVYTTTILRDLAPSTIAWIVSLETFFMFFGGPFMGLLFDNYGPRPLLLAGTFSHVFGLMMASISTKYWHFVLTQGICSPLGASAIFYAAMSSLVTWFHKRRGLALGIMASGSSLGGVVFPIMVQYLIPEVGFPWAMRIAAFMILALLIVANFTVRSRLIPTPRRFDPRAFTRPLLELPFLLLAISAFIVFFGLFIPFTFLPLQAMQVGIDPTLDLYVIPILNAVSIFGRITPGWLSDRVGRFNTTIVTIGMCGVLIFALWLPATAVPPVIVFAALYGFGSGAFVSLLPALTAAVTPDMRTIGVRNGTVFAFVSIGALCGNPIAGALISQDAGHYQNLKIFGGSFLCAGTLIMIVVRMILSRGKVWTKV